MLLKLFVKQISGTIKLIIILANIAAFPQMTTIENSKLCIICPVNIR